ncbi:dcb0144a-8e08-4d8f-b40c-5af67b59cdf4 [Thermothielavioides terrestris]|uniref:Dcb0144a-8e08-4d8f-b40c-5af67b59cdf4 n=1 Tax=Thermothielavioides terrestris TaxID=2587410 RepID=A0A446BV60_9PEZI|nr:dcb0144a-8e08-4d8f-b40c-5af67b59cdf4 [Thermothielavioides terrestris]
MSTPTSMNFQLPAPTARTPERECFGRHARVKTVFMDTRQRRLDSLLLNTGDELPGTVFSTFYSGEIAETLNQMIVFDTMTLGNHEFDRDDNHLGQFLENLSLPIVSANIVSDQPVLNPAITPFHIFPQYDLAVIGITTDTTPGISSPGKGTTFGDHVVSAHNTYGENQRLACETTSLHLTMGGHSYRPLVLGDFMGAVGPFLTMVNNRDGDEVFIVTAYRRGKYLGYIDVTYDKQGKVLAYQGGPIPLTNATAQESELQKQVSRGICAEYEPGTANGTGDVLVALTTEDKPLDKAADYRIVMVDFVAFGGDKFFSAPI